VFLTLEDGLTATPVHGVVMRRTVATKLRRKQELDSLPDGTYDGTWGGYHVCFSVAGIEYELQTTDGIRTPSAPCKVVVHEGGITVEAV